MIRCTLPIPDLVHPARPNTETSHDPAKLITKATPCRGGIRYSESIEPGVRALVQLFALEFGWITYTSCEGHIYAKTGLLPVERHVGIAPRNEHERTQIISTLVSLRRAMSLKTLVGPVEISVIPSRLESPARTLSVVDFCFLRRRWRSWRAYFCALEPIYDGALQKLHEVSRRRRRR